MDIETKLKSIVSPNGTNLYEHFLNTIGKLVQDHPENAYDAFEEFSHFVKASGYKYDDTSNYRDSNRLREGWEDIGPFLNKMKDYFGYVEKQGEEEDEGQESNPIGYVPDMMTEERLFRQIGVGFGEIETFLIFNSIKKFTNLKQATQAKFWGKITGTVKDYYVVEAVVEGGEEEEIAEPHEAKGSGVNAKQYFVSTDILNENGWVELPLLMPRHIIQARKIKHAFTGDLDQKINSSPSFNGTEREYLRAQIARIAHSTTLIQKGLYFVKTEDDGGDPNLQEIEAIEDEEELKPLKGAQLADLNNWCHFNASILQEGRLIHAEIEDEEIDEDQKELLQKQKEFNDPFSKRLNSVSSDSYLDLPTCWILKTHGNFKTTRHQYKNELVHDTLISLRSLVWPGVYYICKDEFVSSVYIGNGHKYSDTLYYPQFPYLIQSEPESKTEEVEPNPPGCENEVDEDEGEGQSQGEDQEEED